MDISVVIPLYNEAESLRELHAWIKRVMENHAFSYEVLFIDDGSNDDSWNIILDLARNNPEVRGFKFAKNYGKTAALQTGFNETQGQVVITMDADLQDSPDEIPELYKMITEDGYDLVSGWKQKRYDPITKTLPTKLFNATTRMIHDIPLHDMNCGLKAYNSKVTKNIIIYGEMHRYIPVVAKWSGFGKIGEKVVHHQARKYGHTKFGLERFFNGFLDLLSITFVNKFGKSPMHFFGLFGILSFLGGLAIATYLIGEKLYSIYNHQPYRNVTDNPLFFLGLTAALIGSQMFLAGFLGELLVRNSVKKDEYTIAEKT
ncbi:glycosyl transferase family 2 [Leadbetterella byssophila DSM 17132]|uniref:Glycosyl transferase family 2 n=1 Tax=Leadbetterella byssophila (strain DSM 17132 / JCM 16389 / KACC 11308 / NBRC 106382 / 4M15) TaxID=649349 RepID=E4RZ65_LEAB4|nr:glycosyltransferase family 2 protein [Leadbetterella byssophila]ADQ19183.1 glycosyl transferase family 2 [Leadbetterella byssophila DSM 17132]